MTQGEWEQGLNLHWRGRKSHDGKKTNKLDLEISTVYLLKQVCNIQTFNLHLNLKGMLKSEFNFIKLRVHCQTVCGNIFAVR